MPTVVVVIDELADLMLVAAKEVEESICRGGADGPRGGHAPRHRDAAPVLGRHHRPDEGQHPSRIAFAVASSLESRIILDTTGAEKLVGKGDMLYFPLGSGKPQRVQGCFISPEEIERVVAFVKRRARPTIPVRSWRRSRRPRAGTRRAAASRPRPTIRRATATSCSTTPSRWCSRRAGVRLHAPAAAEARLFARGASRRPDGRARHRRPVRGARSRGSCSSTGPSGRSARWAGRRRSPRRKPNRFGSIQDVFESHDALE